STSQSDVASSRCRCEQFNGIGGTYLEPRTPNGMVRVPTAWNHHSVRLAKQVNSAEKQWLICHELPPRMALSCDPCEPSATFGYRRINRRIAEYRYRRKPSECAPWQSSRARNCLTLSWTAASRLER